MRKILVALVALLPFTAMPQEWEKIDPWTHVNVGSVYKTENGLSVWVKYGDGKYTYLEEYDCNGSYRKIAELNILSRSEPVEEEWQFVTPDSYQVRTQKLICNR